ncbi:hypothetical protein ISS30_09710 [bacterium]|nr:hypothetical protein [FCB group bacterium]MBL7191960.1 hypothetical protein [bacterium]
MLSILFLCRGNVTRSPFAAGYLYHLFRNSELKDKMEMDIDSSGVEGKFNVPVHPRVLQKGLEMGFDLAMYRSKHASLKLLQRADIIIVFDSKQMKRFQGSYPQMLQKVYHVREFGHEEGGIEDIKDPSSTNTDEDFAVFFETAIAEIDRIWEYLKSKYYEAEKQGIEFGPALFKKREIPKEYAHQKKYNFLTRRTFPICPYCQSKKLRRIKRKGFMQKNIYPFFNGYPFHCGNCNRDVILFIGSEIRSKRRSDSKKTRWEKFLQSEETSKGNHPDNT